MKNKALKFYILFVLIMSLYSCEIIGDIFEAGVWVGVIIVLAVIALIIYIIAKMRRR
ncbi:MAG TPA: hypothetical protein VHI78_09350 [Bacteroidales bacterium]|jgi:hypothetical protein|nr:hypothetical protein [Bacteroidales bacterium]